jgi:hypothetical protein
MKSNLRMLTCRRAGALVLTPIAALAFWALGWATTVSPVAATQTKRYTYTSFGLADWDRDGHQDIVTRENATGNLWLYPGESKRGPGSVQRVQIGNGW